MLTISEICRLAFDTASQKGFHDFDNPAHITRERVSEMLLLVISEITEAMEAMRDISATDTMAKSNPMANRLVNALQSHQYTVITPDGEKPEGFAIELADAVIRICDTAQTLGIDLEYAIKVKMGYNLTRPIKHGRAF